MKRSIFPEQISISASKAFVSRSHFALYERHSLYLSTALKWQMHCKTLTRPRPILWTWAIAPLFILLGHVRHLTYTLRAN